MDFKFDGGSIAEVEWEWMKSICESLKAKTIIEVGSGFSTICLSNIMDHIDSYETVQGFIDELKKKINPEKVSFFKYSYPNFPVNKNKYDIGFVDGPGGGNFNGRMNSMLFVEPLTDYIFIHDFSRKNEKSSREFVFKDKWKIEECKLRTMLLKRN